MKVVLAGVNEERIRQTVSEFEETGAQVLGVKADVSQAESVLSNWQIQSNCI